MNALEIAIVVMFSLWSLGGIFILLWIWASYRGGNRR